MQSRLIMLLACCLSFALGWSLRKPPPPAILDEIEEHKCEVMDVQPKAVEADTDDQASPAPPPRESAPWERVVTTVSGYGYLTDIEPGGKVLTFESKPLPDKEIKTILFSVVAPTNFAHRFFMIAAHDKWSKPMGMCDWEIEPERYKPGLLYEDAVYYTLDQKPYSQMSIDCSGRHYGERFFLDASEFSEFILQKETMLASRINEIKQCEAEIAQLPRDETTKKQHYRLRAQLRDAQGYTNELTRTINEAKEQIKYMDERRAFVHEGLKHALPGGIMAEPETASDE